MFRRVALSLLLLAFVALLFALALARRTPVPAVNMTPFPAIAPGTFWLGQVFASCNFSQLAYAPAAIVRSFENYTFMFSTSTHRISRTVLWMPYSELTIGRLILDWGTPTGFYQHGVTRCVYWKDRSVYVVGETWGPDSSVNVIMWENEPSAAAWRGFVEARAE